MKRIFILTAGFGEGHNTAARGVRDALIRLGGDRVKTLYFDLFADCYGRLNELARKAYLAAINHTPLVWEQIYRLIDSTTMVESNLPALSKMRRHLSALLEEHKPEAVVSTYPVYNYLLDRLRREGTLPALRQITVVTDSISINSIWYRCHSDAFLVPNAATGEILQQAGVDAAKVHVTGFPVSPVFADLSRTQASHAPEDGTRAVLLMINSDKKHAPELAAKLAARPDIRLTVTAGRDESLHRKVEAAVANSAHPVEIIGWTDQMPALLMRSNLLISKAGGATVQESTAACCPVILSKVVPGQEEGNARLILENEAGALCETPEAIISMVDKAFADNATLLAKWRTNMAALSRPDAALQAARFVLNSIRL